MDTTTGQQQMAEFLAAKTRDVRAVINQAREVSATHTAGIGEVWARYDRRSLRDDYKNCRVAGFNIQDDPDPEPT